MKHMSNKKTMKQMIGFKIMLMSNPIPSKYCVTVCGEIHQETYSFTIFYSQIDY